MATWTFYFFLSIITLSNFGWPGSESHNGRFLHEEKNFFCKELGFKLGPLVL